MYKNTSSLNAHIVVMSALLQALVYISIKKKEVTLFFTVITRLLLIGSGFFFSSQILNYPSVVVGATLIENIQRREKELRNVLVTSSQNTLKGKTRAAK